MAVIEAENALHSFKDDSERRNELTFNYVPPSMLDELQKNDDHEKVKKPDRPKSTKRKSLLPPPQKLTPLDQLDYRESPSARIDPELIIPNERLSDGNCGILPELITGQGDYLVTRFLFIRVWGV